MNLLYFPKIFVVYFCVCTLVSSVLHKKVASISHFVIEISLITMNLNCTPVVWQKRVFPSASTTTACTEVLPQVGAMETNMRPSVQLRTQVHWGVQFSRLTVPTDTASLSYRNGPRGGSFIVPQ